MFNLKFKTMKKLFFLFSLVVLLGVSGNVMGQGSQQTATINSTRNYWVNSTTGATQDVSGHTGNTYKWNVYTVTAGDDYTLPTWTATAAADASFDFVGADTGFKSAIKWLASGSYVVEVVETGATPATCTTIRRFGVTVIELDLLVVTKDNTGSPITTATTLCNTNEGGIYGASDDDNLNMASVTPVMGTMSATYEVTLFTEKGGASGTEIGTVLNTAGWKFTVVDQSILPATNSSSITWTVTGGTVEGGGSYLTGGTNTITVANGTSTVTIKAVLKNVASISTDDYELKFSINPASVMVENGGTSSTDYLEGQEPATYVGGEATAPFSHKNAAVQINVNPIPNTTKIKFD